MIHRKLLYHIGLFSALLGTILAYVGFGSMVLFGLNSPILRETCGFSVIIGSNLVFVGFFAVASDNLCF
jgi:hypothetical protein